jgi:hypothetical protein
LALRQQQQQQQQQQGHVPAATFVSETSKHPPLSKECLLGTGFDWVGMNVSTHWAVMSTVEAYPQPTGLQSLCDMVIGSRYSKFNRSVSRHAWVRTWQPQTVFVRSDLLKTFVQRVLPCLHHPFVLLTGDSDLTLPRQVDLRFQKILDPALWDQLMQDPRILHMFVENLDDGPHPKVSGLPLGISPYNYPGKQADFVVRHVSQSAAASPLGNRPLQAMHVARMRDGKGQWADRKHVQDLCLNQWSRFCESPGNMNSTALWAATQALPFVICVHGGGLDPSPKAWESLILGTIPIIQHFPGDDAYRHLPVVFVESFTESSITPEALALWRQQLLPWYAESDKRAEVMRRLGVQFWWDKVTAALEGRLSEFMAANPAIAVEGWQPV